MFRSVGLSSLPHHTTYLPRNRIPILHPTTGVLKRLHEHPTTGQIMTFSSQHQQQQTGPTAENTFMWGGQQIKKLPTAQFQQQSKTPTPQSTIRPSIHPKEYNNPQNRPLDVPRSEALYYSQHPTPPPPHPAIPEPDQFARVANRTTQVQDWSNDAIKNPFRSFRQKLSFYFSVRSNEHRSRTPTFYYLEARLNRFYLRIRRWIITRTPLEIALWLLLIPLAYKIYDTLYDNWNLPQIVEIQNYEYHPELPTKHIPYRSPLLPHTLPTHLNGRDSLFIAEFVDYDKRLVDRSKEFIRQRDPPKMGFGRTPMRTYADTVYGFGERLEPQQKPFIPKTWQKQTDLINDSPRPLDQYDIQPIPADFDRDRFESPRSRVD